MHEHFPQELYDKGLSTEDAEEDLERVQAGEIPVVPDTISEEYMAVMVAFLKSPQFQFLKPEIQQAAQQFIQQVVEMAQQTIMRAEQAAQAQQNPQGGAEQPQATAPKKPKGFVGNLFGKIKQGLAK